jgi:hypothetical protein
VEDRVYFANITEDQWHKEHKILLRKKVEPSQEGKLMEKLSILYFINEFISFIHVYPHVIDSSEDDGG